MSWFAHTYSKIYDTLIKICQTFKWKNSSQNFPLKTMKSNKLYILTGVYVLLMNYIFLLHSEKKSRDKPGDTCAHTADAYDFILRCRYK
jgi:hypothetical protein